MQLYFGKQSDPCDAQQCLKSRWLQKKLKLGNKNNDKENKKVPAGWFTRRPSNFRNYHQQWVSQETWEIPWDHEVLLTPLDCRINLLMDIEQRAVNQVLISNYRNHECLIPQGKERQKYHVVEVQPILPSFSTPRGET